jgi:hypothetical protein
MHTFGKTQFIEPQKDQKDTKVGPEKNPGGIFRRIFYSFVLFGTP